MEIFDGAGSGYKGEVQIRDSEVIIRGLERLQPEKTAVRLILAVALIKPAKFEWILQKAAELGVHEIVPLKTRLSDIQIPGDKIAFRLERWDRIVREASKQCRRFEAPRVHAPQSFSDFLSGEEISVCSKFLFSEKSQEPWRLDPNMLSDQVALCVGPEGGWEEGEIERARESGCRICSLGPWILRTETAAIAALSVFQHQIPLLSAPHLES